MKENELANAILHVLVFRFVRMLQRNETTNTINGII